MKYRSNFSAGASEWQGLDPEQWKAAKNGDVPVLSQFQKDSKYKPPFRSPTNLALLKDVRVADFELTANVKSTIPDYGHRDVCLAFGYQDPSHFYYVHFGKQADDRANQIFIVNGAARTKISLTSTSGTPWDDNWHTVRVTRKVGDGSIAVYFDDLTKPVMTAKDTTFRSGQVGVGTFDDTADFREVVLAGVKAESK